MRVILVLAVTAICRAGTLSTSVYGETGFVESVPLLSCSQAGTASAACAAASAPMVMDLQANADYDSLSAAITGGGATGLNMYGRASFSDDLTINIPGVPAGYIQYDFLLTGHSLSSDLGMSVAASQNGTLIADVHPYGPYAAGGDPINISFQSDRAPFTSGVPVSLSVTGLVDTYLQPFHTSPIVQDEFHLTLTGISILDASGHPVSNQAEILSPAASYSGLVTDIPKPSSLVLITLLLEGMIWARMTKRQPRQQAAARR